MRWPSKRALAVMAALLTAIGAILTNYATEDRPEWLANQRLMWLALACVLVMLVVVTWVAGLPPAPIEDNPPSAPLPTGPPAPKARQASTTDRTAGGSEPFQPGVLAGHRFAPGALARAGACP